MTATDERVPAYLGRVLDDHGHPVGTCFTAHPQVLVTAAHVLGGRTEVHIDPLRGGEPFEVAVQAVDQPNDLAALRSHQQFGTPPPWLTSTKDVDVSADVVITGVARVDDPRYAYRFLDAPGTWAGHANRKAIVPGGETGDEIRLARLRSQDVVPGMSGAPVRLVKGDRVAGVVSGRYNSADGWLVHSVWVTPIDAVAKLLSGSLPQPGLPTLTWSDREGRPATVELRGERLTIGRAVPPHHVPDVDLGTDWTVSRHHCQLERANGGWWLRDCGSQNGTFLRRRGQRKVRRVEEPTRLQHGDVICVPASPVDVRSSDYWELSLADPYWTAPPGPPRPPGKPPRKGGKS